MKKLVSFFFILLWVLVAQAQYSNELTIEKVLKTDTTNSGQKIYFPQSENNEVSILRITIPPGKSTGWHTHEFPVFAYVEEGELTVELENNKSLTFQKNSSFSEVINTLHNGINKGTENIILIAFFMGEKGKPLSIHKQN